MIGWGGIADVFRLESDHTQINKSDGVTEATDNEDRTIRFGGTTGNDIIETTDFGYSEDGSVSVKLTQTKDDEAFDTFLKTACPRLSDSSATTTEEVPDETGRKIGGAASAVSAQQYLLMSYGAQASDNKIPVVCNPGYYKKTSGSKSSGAGKFMRPSIEFQSIAALQNIAIGPDLFDSTIVTAPVTSVNILEGYHEVIAWLTPAS